MATETEHGYGVKDRIEVREPQMYDVVLLNDDFTTMDFVVEVLTEVFYHTQSEAEAIMLSVHHQGEGVAGTYTYDIAQSKAAKATGRARAAGYPLRLKVTEAR